MKYILLTGARDYKNLDMAKFIVMDSIDPRGTILIHGNARGIDNAVGNAVAMHFMGSPMMRFSSCEVIPFPAQWTKYRKAAGPIRNREMVKYIEQKKSEGNEVICFAFPLLPRRPHSGTWDCIDRIQQVQLPIVITPEEFDHGLD
jgi:hypothetical protein